MFARLAPRLASSLALSLICATLPALAQETEPRPAMTGAEFEAYATGRTLTFAAGGTVFGTEQYLPGRRVIWAFTDDICKEGIWYEDGDMICFAYEDPSAPQCWKFWRDGTGLRAQFEGDPAGTELSEVAQSDQPLRCLGPDVGV